MHPRFNIKRERNNTIYYRSYENDFCLFHFHSAIELYFVDGGEMEMLVAGQQKTLRGGEMCISLSHDAHAYKTPKSSRSSVFIIPTDICEEFTAATRDRRLASPYITDKSVVAEIKEFIAGATAERINHITRLGYVHLILGVILDKADFTAADKAVDSDLSSKLLMFIEENCTKAISPGEIAHTFGYSQSYISRYFSSCFGITLSEYISVTRLRKAVALLSSGKHTVTYAAMESGFGSMRAFYRAFYKEFECTPKEYAEKNRMDF